jgi:Flp pilus assembly protein TadB
VAAHYQELKKAGLRSEKALGLFLLGLNWAKKGCLALACISLLFLKPLTAALMLAACLAALHFGPTLWLSWRQARRLREIGGKLPLMAALVKLGASAGLDLGAALKRTCRVFAEHYPQHELTYELSALQRRAMTGYSWTEALHQMTLRVEHPAWAKLSSILSQGIIQGGDRRRELEALIAQLDRENGSNLELAIAAFPVKMAALSALAVIGFWLLG